MQALKELQSQFQNYLMNGSTLVLPEIVNDKKLSAEKRLKVYFDAYRIRLMEILKLDYPKTHTLLGDDGFEEAFHQYLSQYPSEHFSVRYFGQHFSRFLAQTKPFSESLVFSEMAHFEWAVSYTTDAKDCMIVTPASLSAIPLENWPDLQFQFHPSVINHAFHWDTPQLWQDIENEKPPRQPIAQPVPIRWLFWRKGLKSLFQSCSPAEDKMVLAVLDGKPFGEICECLMDILPEEEIPMFAAQTLYKWVHEEMISQVN